MATKLKAASPEEVSPGHIKGMIFGKSGVGKTWLATAFPNPYYIDPEGGARLAHYKKRLLDAGGKYLGKELGACNFDTIIEQMQALATEQHPFRTLNIDSITKVYQTTISNEAERLGDKDAFGASKKPAIGYMRRLVNWTNRLDMNVWFVAHETAEWGMVDGKREEIGKIPDVWDKLVYELDLVLHVQQHNERYRTATVYKSRLIGFPVGSRFDLQKNGQDVGYAEFASRYGKDFIEAAPKPIVLATAEQCAEIRRLLGIVKVAEKTIQNMMDKAGAESWEELNDEQATKTIAWLNGLVKGSEKQ